MTVQPPLSKRIVVCPNHPDELSKVSGWDIDFRQLEQGRNDIRFSVHRGPQSIIAELSMSKRVHQRGAPPKGAFTFGITDPQTIRTWQGTTIPDHALLHFGPDTGFDSVSERGHSGIVMSLDQNRLSDRADVFGYDLSGLEGATSLSRVSRQLPELEALKSAVSDMLSQQDQLFADDIEEAISLRILSLLCEDQPAWSVHNGRTRRLVVERALAYFDSLEMQNCSVEALCRAIGTSWRTLDRAFREEYGVGPKAYYNMSRLNRVRRELMRRPVGKRIWEVANDHDFWHMGQFARDYRRLFGELPSQTSAAAS